MHDFNAGILPSGLFWTLPTRDRAFRVRRDGRRAVLSVEDVPVIDTFRFGGPNAIPASVSFRVEWRATGPREPHGSGSAVAATDPRAFLGSLAPATSTGRFSGFELGFSFRSNPGVDTERGFAELGRQRNGVFL